ncbi:hypothetical protein G7Y89_g12019 [Cudoniella acicularis]|uniref:Cytochrome P450 n=1 Tax=Cudoniella acicularis TaxID=354080 RepID=A0A8H4RAV7_9HELO|nr:hypothetical protein G7Y89_g12019 [Cudoniella acicularis]
MASELWNQLVCYSGLILVIWILYGSLWRLFLSPLSKFPGPKLAAWTLRYEFYFDVVKDGGGHYVWEIEKMHKKYGPVVRINPYELHFNDPEFYEEIYAGGNRERDKYAWQTSSGDSAQAMGFTIKHQHHRLRREALNPYFSKLSVLRLESRINDHVRRLCGRLEEYRLSQQPVNLTLAYLALTMDIITDYSFGKSSDMLEKKFTAKWKDTIAIIMRNTSVINHFSWLPRLMDKAPAFLAKALADVSALLDLKKDIQNQVRLVLAKPPNAKVDTIGSIDSPPLF